ncbi:2OG-Fe(II) oxygenase [Aureivirga marina]|uniref:2OG-Fe(II) oxygenase n=1 Tax=Aureivirga marina TaxID=1182451 RepID=UPI0018C9AA03|nr:2OG-Fe(II) oxygenase [Aureivirga marina]
MKKHIITPDVFTIEGFLTEKECLSFINYSESIGFKEATVSTLSGPKMIKGIRNNTRVIINDEDLATEIWNKIKSFIPSVDGKEPLGVNEQFRFYKYDIGERFNKHRDGRFVRNENEESRLTLMIYLNEEFEGGETEFDTFSVQPKTGTALIFLHEIKHKGCKVTEGTKYALRTDIMFEK